MTIIHFMGKEHIPFLAPFLSPQSLIALEQSCLSSRDLQRIREMCAQRQLDRIARETLPPGLLY